MASASLPTYTVEINFNDPSAAASWTDVTAYVRAVSIKRGRSTEFDRVEPGTCEVVLENNDRRFDPTYTSGAYYPNVVPIRGLRVTATWASQAYVLFVGEIESWPMDWPLDGYDATVTVTAVDALTVFQDYQFAGTETYAEMLSSTRVGTICTLLGYGTADRTIATGHTLIEAGSAFSSSALEHVQAVAESEGGVFFVTRGGTLEFQDRQYRAVNETSSRATFADGNSSFGYRNLTPSSDVEFLYNTASISAAGTTITVVDTAGTSAYRTKAFSKSILADQAEATAAGEWYVWRYKDPAVRVKQVEITPSPANASSLWPVLLPVDLSRRYTVSRQPVGKNRAAVGTAISQDGYVESVQWDISPEATTCTLELSPYGAETLWTLGTSSGGTSTYLTW